MFNPFPSIGRDLQIASLQLGLTLSGQGKDAQESGQPDNRKFDPSKVPKDPMVLLGNNG